MVRYKNINVQKKTAGEIKTISAKILPPFAGLIFIFGPMNSAVRVVTILFVEEVNCKFNLECITVHGITLIMILLIRQFL